MKFALHMKSRIWGGAKRNGTAHLVNKTVVGVKFDLDRCYTVKL